MVLHRYATRANQQVHNVVSALALALQCLAQLARLALPACDGMAATDLRRTSTRPCWS